MRLRNVPGSREEIAGNPYCIDEPKAQRGKWSELFGNENPIFLEIGMGKGRFITELAMLHPENNYIGIEKYSSVLVRALEKREEHPELTNLYYIRMDAEELAEVFAEGEVEGIYLNFSDPWPKDRHAKRRLTSRQFLARYEKVMKKTGVLAFKTDNRALFDFSLEEVPAAGWTILAHTFDLHHDAAMNEGNIMTEYEERFSSMGNPICKLIAAKKETE